MRHQLLAAALLLIGGVAHAADDPTGDYLATYTGPRLAELDFTSADARFDGTSFNLSLTLAGTPSRSPNILHVWGINRGAGTPRLNELFDPDVDPTVLWDSLAVLFGNGTLSVVTFPQAGPPTITPIPGGAVFDGTRITASVPAALLPTRGFAPTSYTFQLWSRLRANPAMDGPNTELGDFGPRVFASVPEPAGWALMIAGFGLAGTAARRRSFAGRAIA